MYSLFQICYGDSSYLKLPDSLNGQYGSLCTWYLPNWGNRPWQPRTPYFTENKLLKILSCDNHIYTSMHISIIYRHYLGTRALYRIKVEYCSHIIASLSSISAGDSLSPMASTVHCEHQLHICSQFSDNSTTAFQPLPCQIFSTYTALCSNDVSH